MVIRTSCDWSPESSGGGGGSRIGSCDCPAPVGNGVCVVMVGRIQEEETMAAGRSSRIRERLYGVDGGKRGRKRKGLGSVTLAGGWIGMAELHWDEANGHGRREMKNKLLLGRDHG